jgi:hypothetical protein
MTQPTPMTIGPAETHFLYTLGKGDGPEYAFRTQYEAARAEIYKAGYEAGIQQTLGAICWRCLGNIPIDPTLTVDGQYYHTHPKGITFLCEASGIRALESAGEKQ